MGSTKQTGMNSVFVEKLSADTTKANPFYLVVHTDVVFPKETLLFENVPVLD